MDVSTSSKASGTEIGASLVAPVPVEMLYGALLDVRGFPRWAPGVRRVVVLAGDGEPGMLSEWEVSVLGLTRRVRSVLEEAEVPGFLRWTYEGAFEGWGECFVERVGNGALAEFRTALSPADPLLSGLARSPAVRDAARRHLKRSLVRLGQFVAGEDARISVGPLSAANAACGTSEFGGSPRWLRAGPVRGGAAARPTRG